MALTIAAQPMIGATVGARGVDPIKAFEQSGQMLLCYLHTGIADRNAYMSGL